MKSILTLVMLLGARWLAAQSPGDSLLQAAMDADRLGNGQLACELAQECSALYPLKTRNRCAYYLRSSCKNDWQARENEGKAIWQRLLLSFLGDSLVADDPGFAAFYAGYGWMEEYNFAKALQAILLERNGKLNEAVAMLQGVVDEVLSSPACMSVAGAFAADHLAEILVRHRDFEGALHICRLARERLVTPMPCGNARPSFAHRQANWGLAYAGIGKRDSALIYLLPVAFSEPLQNHGYALTVLDSAIAILARRTTIPVLDQLEMAFDALIYSDTPSMSPYGASKYHDIQCSFTLAEIRLEFMDVEHQSVGITHLRSQYGITSPFPYSKADCRRLLAHSPLYLRAQGKSAAEIYPPSLDRK